MLSADGWLRTGDAARRDEEGYVWIVDRMADCFLSKGHTVYPGDVERVPDRPSLVADAGVVQVAGEAVAAVVVLSAGARGSDQEPGLRPPAPVRPPGAGVGDVRRPPAQEHGGEAAARRASRPRRPSGSR